MPSMPVNGLIHFPGIFTLPVLADRVGNTLLINKCMYVDFLSECIGILVLFIIECGVVGNS
jgi:hypothetical protein